MTGSGYEPRPGPPGGPSPAPPPTGPQPTGPMTGPPPPTAPPSGPPPHQTGPLPAAPDRPGLDQKGRVQGGRISALWIGLIVAAVLLILLLIFIAQNSTEVTIHFLGLRGQISLAIALLLAAVVAVLLVAIPGTARIVQLRRALRRNAIAPPSNRPSKRQ